VPAVVGLKFPEAEATIAAAKLRAVRVDADSDQAPEQVLVQQPEAGRRAEQGSNVTLTGSSATLTVPDVVGKTREPALSIRPAQRRTAHFVHQASAEKPPGTVLGTDPKAGDKIPKAAPGQPNPTVTVSIAKEPPVPVPDVSGQDPGTAETTLKNAGFQ